MEKTYKIYRREQNFASIMCTLAIQLIKTKTNFCLTSTLASNASSWPLSISLFCLVRANWASAFWRRVCVKVNSSLASNKDFSHWLTSSFCNCSNKSHFRIVHSNRKRKKFSRKLTLAFRFSSSLAISSFCRITSSWRLFNCCVKSLMSLLIVGMPSVV